MTDSIALQNVRNDLGEDLGKQFEGAVALARNNEDDTDVLTKATKIFVNILTDIPQEKTKSCGYAEVLLAYGRVLLFFLRKTAAENNPLLGGNVEAELPKGKHAAAADATAADTAAADATAADATAADATAAPTDTAAPTATGNAAADTITAPTDTGDAAASVPAPAPAAASADASDEITPAPAADGAEKVDAGDDEEDVDTEELTWEQLEHARLTFENLGAAARPRLADVFETLGDLLMESDQSEGAAAEYAKAIAILLEATEPKLRLVSHLHYARYLALRRESPQPAVEALESAVAVFERVADAADKKEGDESVLKDMREELRVFKAALGPALAKVQAANSFPAAKANGAQAPVVVVQPKRRIVPKAVVDAGDAEAAQPKAKKARIEEPPPKADVANGAMEIEKDAAAAAPAETEAGEDSKAREEGGQGVEEGNKGEEPEEGVKLEEGSKAEVAAPQETSKGTEEAEKRAETEGKNVGEAEKKSGEVKKETDGGIVDAKMKDAEVAAEAVPDTKVEVGQDEAQAGVGGASVTMA